MTRPKVGSFKAKVSNKVNFTFRECVNFKAGGYTGGTFSGYLPEMESEGKSIEKYTVPIHDKFIYVFRTNPEIEDGAKFSLYIEAKGICDKVEDLFTDENIEDYLIHAGFKKEIYAENDWKKMISLGKDDWGIKQGVLMRLGLDKLEGIKGKYQYYKPGRNDTERKNDSGKTKKDDYIKLERTISDNDITYYVCISDTYLPGARIENLRDHLDKKTEQSKRFTEITIQKGDLKAKEVPLIDFHSQVRMNYFAFKQFRKKIIDDVIDRKLDPDKYIFNDTVYRLMAEAGSIADYNETFESYLNCWKDKTVYDDLDSYYTKLNIIRTKCDLYGASLVNWLDSAGYRAMLYDFDYYDDIDRKEANLEYRTEIMAIEKGAKFLKQEFDDYYNYDSEFAKLDQSQNILEKTLDKINYFAFDIEMGRKAGGDLAMQIAELWPFVTTKYGHEKATKMTAKFLTQLLKKSNYQFGTITDKTGRSYVVFMSIADEMKDEVHQIKQFGKANLDNVFKKIDSFGKIAGSLHVVNGILQFGNAIERGHADAEQVIELASASVDCFDWALKVRKFGTWSKVASKWLGPVGAALDGTVALFYAADHYEKGNIAKTLAYGLQAVGCCLIVVASILKAPVAVTIGLVLFIGGIIWSNAAPEETEEMIWLRHSGVGTCSRCPDDCPSAIKDTESCKTDPEPYKDWTIYKNGAYHWPKTAEEHFDSLNRLLKKR